MTHNGCVLYCLNSVVGGHAVLCMHASHSISEHCDRCLLHTDVLLGLADRRSGDAFTGRTEETERVKLINPRYIAFRICASFASLYLAQS